MIYFILFVIINIRSFFYFSILLILGNWDVEERLPRLNYIAFRRNPFLDESSRWPSRRQRMRERKGLAFNRNRTIAERKKDILLSNKFLCAPYNRLGVYVYIMYNSSNIRSIHFSFLHWWNVNEKIKPKD